MAIQIPILTNGKTTLYTKDTLCTEDIELNVNVDGDGSEPTGTVEIVTNGDHDVAQYATAHVNVPQLDTSDADAVALDIRKGKIAYVKGVKVIGSREVYTGAYSATHYPVTFILNQCHATEAPTVIEKGGQTYFNIYSDSVNATSITVDAVGATVERLSGTGSGTSLYASYKLSNPTQAVTITCTAVAE